MLTMATAAPAKPAIGIHNVLIATDLSRSCASALQYGLDFARRYQATTEVLYVVPNEEFLLAGPEVYVAARDAARRDLLELKEQMRRSSGYIEGEDYHLVLMEGDPAGAILDCAHSRHADLIVLGTHGRSGLGKVLMGSVAERVFRHSTVPVLTIGPHLRHAEVVPHRILLATNFSAASKRAAAYAASLAREHGGELIVLHVVDQAREEIVSFDPIRRHHEEQMRAMMHDADDIRMELRVEVGKPAPTILEVAATLQCDFLMLGVRAHGGLLERFGWPVAYEVVRGATMPVLTVRA